MSYKSLFSSYKNNNNINESFEEVLEKKNETTKNLNEQTIVSPNKPVKPRKIKKVDYNTIMNNIFFSNYLPDYQRNGTIQVNYNLDSKYDNDSSLKEASSLKFLYPEAKEKGLFNSYPIYTPSHSDIDYHFRDTTNDKYAVPTTTTDIKMNPNNPWNQIVKMSSYPKSPINSGSESQVNSYESLSKATSLKNIYKVIEEEHLKISSPLMNSNLSSDMPYSTSEIEHVTAGMHPGDFEEKRFATIRKKKLLNIMGNKMDYDTKTDSNLYKSRPSTTTNTNYRSSGNLTKHTYNEKLDTLIDLSNIKIYKKKVTKNNFHAQKLISLGNNKPSSTLVDYIKKTSPHPVISPYPPNPSRLDMSHIPDINEEYKVNDRDPIPSSDGDNKEKSANSSIPHIEVRTNFKNKEEFYRKFENDYVNTQIRKEYSSSRVPSAAELQKILNEKTDDYIENSKNQIDNSIFKDSKSTELDRSITKPKLIIKKNGNVLNDLRLKSKQRPGTSQSTTELPYHINYKEKMQKWRKFIEYNKITNNYNWDAKSLNELNIVSTTQASNEFQKDYKNLKSDKGKNIIRNEIEFNHKKKNNNNLFVISENLNRHKY